MNNNPITMIANVATKIKGLSAHAAGGAITKPLVSGQHLFGEAGPEAVLRCADPYMMLWQEVSWKACGLPSESRRAAPPSLFPARLRGRA